MFGISILVFAKFFQFLWNFWWAASCWLWERDGSSVTIGSGFSLALQIVSAAILTLYALGMLMVVNRDHVWLLSLCFFQWHPACITVLALKLPLRHPGLALQCWSNGIANDLGWGGMICFESCQSRSACWGFYTTYSVHFLAYSVSFSCQMGAPIRHLHLMRFSSWGLHPFSSVLEGSSFCWDLIASLIRAGICCVQGVLWLSIIQFMLDWNQVCNSKSFSLNYLL